MRCFNAFASTRHKLVLIKLSHEKITTGFGLEIWEVYTLFSHDLTLNYEFESEYTSRRMNSTNPARPNRKFKCRYDDSFRGKIAWRIRQSEYDQALYKRLNLAKTWLFLWRVGTYNFMNKTLRGKTNKQVRHKPTCTSTENS